MSVLWVNGALVPEADAMISALDRGLLSGYGLFETMRTYGGKPWAFDDHWSRLEAGGELIDLKTPSGSDVRTAISEVLDANNLSDAGVRVTVTGGSGPVDVQSDPDGIPSVIVIAWPLRDYSDLYAGGAALVTLTEGARPLAGVKTTSYAASVAGRVFAQRCGADDAVFLGGQKRVLEATGSNLCVARGEQLRTPPLDDAILPGITRAYVLDVARDAGFEVLEEPLYVDDLLASDEVVLTSSLREVYPARSIDGHELNRSDVAERLRDAYHRRVLSALTG
jgi:branched-subunit amino acid aminotransferase/4-amino-4-deoxychorismate lyase